MKKLISLLLVICILCPLLAGCVQKQDVSDELKTEIIEDYLVWSGIQSDKAPQEIECEFLGKYGESVAVYFHTAGAYETPIIERVVGYKFEYPDSRVIRIWNNGKFYKMSDAYDMGLLNMFNILSIKKKSRSLNFKDPYFIFEEKIYNEPNFGLETLAYNAVSVIIDKGISRYSDKNFSIEFFGDIEIIEMCELWRSDETHQEFLLVFNEASAEELMQIIDHLYEIDGIMEVCPLYSGILDLSPNDELFKDEDTYIQWALEKINTEMVWEFTTGNLLCHRK